MVLVLAIPPVSAVAAFAACRDRPMTAMLDSAAEEGGGRFSFVAVDPFRVIVAGAAGVMVDGVAVAGDPFAVLEDQLARFTLLNDEDSPVPFRTGAVGFLGYELGRHLERLPLPRPDRWGLPEMVVGLYDLIAAFDHQTGGAWIIASGFPETDAAARASRASRRAAWLRRRLAMVPALPAPPAFSAPPAPPRQGVVWVPDISLHSYHERVERIIAYIRAGDIFQANFTQGFTAPCPAGLDPFELYRRLRSLTPAPFAACLDCGGGLWLAGASPERFLALDAAGRVETRPIKGTRPRGASPEADTILLAELVASGKDRAENLMITDLLRNDLGRVCQVGSIAVQSLIKPVSFASVHHLVSLIEGRLRPSLGPVDLLRAAFPGGSITGAPKIRAMQIIAELEAGRRGPYCGAVVWIGFDRTMDSCITIRTLVVTGTVTGTANGRAVIAQAGGGITAESCPELEYQELLVKVRPLLATLSPGCEIT